MIAQTTEERITALETLLPLLEAHLDCHGRIVSRAQWESAYEPPPKGYVPPTPEPDCSARCSSCVDFGVQCGLREEAWAREWDRLRGSYPQLYQLEELLYDLVFGHADWAAALYWVYVQPWDAFDRAARADRELAGRTWIAERFEGYLPTYVPKGMRAEEPEYDKRAHVMRLRAEKLSHRQIQRITGVDRKTIGKWLEGYGAT